MTHDRPAVSIVVSTYQRAALLPKLLAAFEKQTYSRSDLEVVIVDNGSTDDTPAALASLTDTSPLRMKTARLETNAGSSGGRNAGWRMASGDIIAFTDDDCLPDPDWIKEGLAAMEESGVALVQGRTVPQRRIRALERGAGSEEIDGLFPTCNVFYRRSALEASGGFDQADAGRLGFRPGSFGSGYGFGEDTLLAWRVARPGGVAYARRAVVRHAVGRPPVSEYIVRYWVVKGFPPLVREVPELRRTLLRSRLFLGYRRLPLYATAIVLVTPFRLAAVATALWWIGGRTRDVLRRGGRVRRKVVAVPVEMAVDAVTTAALWWGSLRSRTIVI